MITVGSTKVWRFFMGATTTTVVSIGSLYKGADVDAATKIWEAVSSCLGSGIWRGAKPWINSEKWKNFK